MTFLPGRATFRAVLLLVVGAAAVIGLVAPAMAQEEEEGDLLIDHIPGFSRDETLSGPVEAEDIEGDHRSAEQHRHRLRSNDTSEWRRRFEAPDNTTVDINQSTNNGPGALDALFLGSMAHAARCDPDSHPVEDVPDGVVASRTRLDDGTAVRSVYLASPRTSIFVQTQGPQAEQAFATALQLQLERAPALPLGREVAEINEGRPCPDDIPTRLDRLLAGLAMGGVSVLGLVVVAMAVLVPRRHGWTAASRAGVAAGGALAVVVLAVVVGVRLPTLRDPAEPPPLRFPVPAHVRPEVCQAYGLLRAAPELSEDEASENYLQAADLLNLAVLKLDGDGFVERASRARLQSLGSLARSASRPESSLGGETREELEPRIAEQLDQIPSCT